VLALGAVFFAIDWLWTTAANGATLREVAPAQTFRAAQRVSGYRVYCYEQSDWTTLVDRWYPGTAYVTYGLYRSDIGGGEIDLPQRDVCAPLQQWRTADRYDLSFALFVLGHEMGHGWQQAHGLPYDEHIADCIGQRDLNKNRRALGITRRVPVAFHTSGC
jgi:hypothetical protein